MSGYKITAYRSVSPSSHLAHWKDSNKNKEQVHARSRVAQIIIPVDFTSSHRLHRLSWASCTVPSGRSQLVGCSIGATDAQTCYQPLNNHHGGIEADLLLDLRTGGLLSDDCTSLIPRGFSRGSCSVKSGPTTSPLLLRASGTRHKLNALRLCHWASLEIPENSLTHITRGWRNASPVAALPHPHWSPTNARYFSGNHSLCDIDRSRLR